MNPQIIDPRITLALSLFGQVAEYRKAAHEMQHVIPAEVQAALNEAVRAACQFTQDYLLAPEKEPSRIVVPNIQVATH